MLYAVSLGARLGLKGTKHDIMKKPRHKTPLSALRALRARSSGESDRGAPHGFLTRPLGFGRDARSTCVLCRFRPVYTRGSLLRMASKKTTVGAANRANPAESHPDPRSKSAPGSGASRGGGAVAAVMSRLPSAEFEAGFD